MSWGKALYQYATSFPQRRKCVALLGKLLIFWPLQRVVLKKYLLEYRLLAVPDLTLLTDFFMKPKNLSNLHTHKKAN